MIKLVAMDVDGTLTDGGLYMDGNGGEFKRFDVKDGMGIVELMRSGVEVALISGRTSAATLSRAKDLGIEYVVNGTRDKLPVLRALARQLGIRREETVFIGDDVSDVTCLEWAGLGVAVADSHQSALSAADFVTSKCGGAGAVREVADKILSENSPAKVRRSAIKPVEARRVIKRETPSAPNKKLSGAELADAVKNLRS